MRRLLRFFGFLFTFGSIIFVLAAGTAVGLYFKYSQDLPDYSYLQDYQPPVMTRVHASDGSLLAEYARERRLYLPIQAVPKLVINAFVSAEDKNFWEHSGLDLSGIARAGMVYLQNFGTNKRPQGASTITQQVAKNFLLTNEVSFTRKIKEALLALKLEKAYSKEKILELYVNEIYLGLGAYGVAAASLLYFDKSVHELSIAEAAHRAAQLGDRPHGGERLPQAAGRREGEEGATRRHVAAVRRPCLRGRVLRRGRAARDLGEIRREGPLRGRPVRAHLARSEDPGDGAQGLRGRPGELRRAAGLARRRQQDRHHRRLGREARRGQIALRRRLEDGGGAGDERPGGAHRLPAGPRDRRRRAARARGRHRAGRRRQMGEGGERAAARQ